MIYFFRSLRIAAAFALMLTMLAPAHAQEAVCTKFSTHELNEYLDDAEEALQKQNLPAAFHMLEFLYREMRCLESLIQPKQLERFAQLKIIIGFFDQDEEVVRIWTQLVRDTQLGLPWPVFTPTALVSAIGELEEVPVTTLTDTFIVHPSKLAVFMNGDVLKSPSARQEVNSLIQIVDKKGKVKSSHWQSGLAFKETLIAKGRGVDPPKWVDKWQPELFTSDEATSVAEVTAQPSEDEEEDREATAEPEPAAPAMPEPKAEPKELTLSPEVLAPIQDAPPEGEPGSDAEEPEELPTETDLNSSSTTSALAELMSKAETVLWNEEGTPLGKNQGWIAGVEAAEWMTNCPWAGMETNPSATKKTVTIADRIYYIRGRTNRGKFVEVLKACHQFRAARRFKAWRASRRAMNIWAGTALGGGFVLTGVVGFAAGVPGLIIVAPFVSGFFVLPDLIIMGPTTAILKKSMLNALREDTFTPPGNAE